MCRHKWKSVVGFSAALLIAMMSCPARAQAESNDIKLELEKLKAEFEQIKTSYEARIRALEEKVAEQETLKATLEQKQKEIQALNEKLTELEKREEVEVLAGRLEELEKAEVPRHKAAPVGAYGGLMNPDVSVVVNVQGLVTDNDANPADERIMVKHSELALQGYLYPGIRADFIGAVGQHPEEGGHVHTHVKVGEAYASFLDLPANFQLQLRRKLLDFGRLNPIHSAHWPIA